MFSHLKSHQQSASFVPQARQSSATACRISDNIIAYTKKQKEYEGRDEGAAVRAKKRKENVNKQAGKYERLWRGTKIAKQIAKGKNFSPGVAQRLTSPRTHATPHPLSTVIQCTFCTTTPSPATRCPRIYINICAYLAKRPLHAT